MPRNEKLGLEWGLLGHPKGSETAIWLVIGRHGPKAETTGLVFTARLSYLMGKR